MPDLIELERRLDEALEKEIEESLMEWLMDQRDSGILTPEE